MPKSYSIPVNCSILSLQRNAKRVLVTGDRKWTNAKAIARELGECSCMKVLIHGDANGADSIADRLGRVILGGRNVKPFPADWKRSKRAAGPIRNRQMLKEGKPDFVLAFHKDLSKSKGTKDMVNAARKKGIPVKVIIR